MLFKLSKYKMQLLSEVNPDRIYVENIRSLFNLSTKVTKMLCEMATKEGFFHKKYGVYCSNCGRLIKSYDSKLNINTEIKCDLCLDLDDDIFESFNTEIIEFYTLNGKSN